MDRNIFAFERYNDRLSGTVDLQDVNSSTAIKKLTRYITWSTPRSMYPIWGSSIASCPQESTSRRGEVREGWWFTEFPDFAVTIWTFFGDKMKCELSTLSAVYPTFNWRKNVRSPQSESKPIAYCGRYDFHNSAHSEVRYRKLCARARVMGGGAAGVKYWEIANTHHRSWLQKEQD